MNEPKLRIEFSVRDIETGRYVTFSDDVSMVGIKEFFERAALGVEHIFDTTRAPAAVRLISGAPGNKIMAIKMVREFTSCGLKEAKDAVERSDGIVFVCEDGRDALGAMKLFEQEGFSVERVPVELKSLINRNILRYTKPT